VGVAGPPPVAHLPPFFPQQAVAYPAYPYGSPAGYAAFPGYSAPPPAHTPYAAPAAPAFVTAHGQPFHYAYPPQYPTMYPSYAQPGPFFFTPALNYIPSASTASATSTTTSSSMSGTQVALPAPIAGPAAATHPTPVSAAAAAAAAAAAYYYGAAGFSAPAPTAATFPFTQGT
jgi:hypothetical protein